MIKIRKKKAQQLVEFLLVTPVLIIILGILTEYAYALNINMTLTKALKTITASVYSEIKPSMTKADIEELVTKDLNTYLVENNVPTKAENKIHVGYITSGSTAIFMASYTYLSAFTLPNMWFKFLPDQFVFFATSAVPKAFLDDNNYNKAITSSVLDNIWSSTASFSSQDAFNDSKKGVMKTTTGRSNILFLVPTTAPTLTTPYALVNWDGTVKKDTTTGNTFTIDMSNGKFCTCSAIACPAYGQTFYNYITNKGYYNVFFVSKTDVPDINYLAPTDWLNPAGTTDISDISVQGLLKNILSITKNNMSVGNFDNINVSDYNTSVSTGNTYTMKSYGSFILMYPTTDFTETAIAKINATVKSKDYDFGS